MRELDCHFCFAHEPLPGLVRIEEPRGHRSERNVVIAHLVVCAIDCPRAPSDDPFLYPEAPGNEVPRLHARTHGVGCQSGGTYDLEIVDVECQRISGFDHHLTGRGERSAVHQHRRISRPGLEQIPLRGPHKFRVNPRKASFRIGEAQGALFAAPHCYDFALQRNLVRKADPIGCA